MQSGGGGKYTIQTSAYAEQIAEGGAAASEGLPARNERQSQRRDSRGRSTPNSQRSSKLQNSPYAYRPGKTLNYLGTKTPTSSGTIYNAERVVRPKHNAQQKVMQPGQKMPAEAQRVDELFETSDGRTLFKKIGDKLMANAKGGKLREQFRKFDLDGNGSVDYDELRTGLAQMNYGLTDEQFRMLCKAVDKDGGGEIDYDEFMESFDAWQPLGERNDARSDNIMTAAPWELVHGDWEIMKAKASSEEVEKAVNDAAADSEIVRKDGRFVHSAIVNKLNQKHETMRKIFVNFDRDQSGDLDPEELREGLKYAYLNLDPVQIGKFVAYADRDGGGTIDIDEFMAHFATPDYGHPQGFITQGGGMRMNRVPLDPSQQVKMDELERLGAALRETSYQAPSRVIRAFTANDYHADGRVSVHELRDILHTLRPDLSSEQVHSLLPDAKTQDNKMRFVNYKQLLSHASDAPHPLGSIATAPKMLRRPDETISSLRATSTRLSLSSNQSVAEAMQRGRYSNTPDWDAARGSKDTFNLTQPAVGTASYGAPTEMMTTNKLRQLQMLQANDKHRKTRRWGRLRGTEARRMHNKTYNSVDLMSQSPRHVDDDLIDMKLESRVGGRKKARRQYTEHVRLFGGMEAMIKDFMRNGLVAPDGSFKQPMQTQNASATSAASSYRPSTSHTSSRPAPPIPSERACSAEPLGRMGQDIDTSPISHLSRQTLERYPQREGFESLEAAEAPLAPAWLDTTTSMHRMLPRNSRSAQGTRSPVHPLGNHWNTNRPMSQQASRPGSRPDAALNRQLLLSSNRISLPSRDSQRHVGLSANF